MKEKTSKKIACISYQRPHKLFLKKQTKKNLVYFLLYILFFLVAIIIKTRKEVWQMSTKSKIYSRFTKNIVDDKNAKRERKQKVRAIDKELHNLDNEQIQEDKEKLYSDIDLLKTKRNTERVKQIPQKHAKKFKRARKTSELISTLTSVLGIAISFNLIDLKYLFTKHYLEYLLNGGLFNILFLFVIGYMFNRGINFTYVLLGEDTTIKHNFLDYLKRTRYIFIAIMIVASIVTNFIFWNTVLKNIIFAILFSCMFDTICFIATLMHTKYYYMDNIQLDAEREHQENKKADAETKKEDKKTDTDADKNTDKLKLAFFGKNQKDKVVGNTINSELRQNKDTKKNSKKTEKKPGKTPGKPGRKIDARTRKKIIEKIQALEKNSYITKKKINFNGDDKLLKIVCEELIDKLVYLKIDKNNKRRFYRL